MAFNSAEIAGCKKPSKVENLRCLTNQNASKRDDEHENVTTHGVVVGSVASTEVANEGIQLVLGQGLKHSRCADQAGDGGRQGGGEASSVDQRSPQRNQLHGLQANRAFESPNPIAQENGICTWLSVAMP